MDANIKGSKVNQIKDGWRRKLQKLSQLFHWVMLQVVNKRISITHALIVKDMMKAQIIPFKDSIFLQEENTNINST